MSTFSLYIFAPLRATPRALIRCKIQTHLHDISAVCVIFPPIFPLFLIFLNFFDLFDSILPFRSFPQLTRAALTTPGAHATIGISFQRTGNTFPERRVKRACVMAESAGRGRRRIPSPDERRAAPDTARTSGPQGSAGWNRGCIFRHSSRQRDGCRFSIHQQ